MQQVELDATRRVTDLQWQLREHSSPVRASRAGFGMAASSPYRSLSPPHTMSRGTSPVRSSSPTAAARSQLYHSSQTLANLTQQLAERDGELVVVTADLEQLRAENQQLLLRVTSLDHISAAAAAAGGACDSFLCRSAERARQVQEEVAILRGQLTVTERQLEQQRVVAAAAVAASMSSQQGAGDVRGKEGGGSAGEVGSSVEVQQLRAQLLEKEVELADAGALRQLVRRVYLWFVRQLASISSTLMQ